MEQLPDISIIPQPSDSGHWLMKRLRQLVKGNIDGVAKQIGVSQPTLSKTLNCQIRSKKAWEGLKKYYTECLRIEAELKKYDQSIYS